MDNDALRHELDDLTALVREQIGDLSAMQQKRSELNGKGWAAEGTVEVTVDAQRMVADIVIDESYLDDYEFIDIGDHVKTAARAAVEQLERMSAALLEPLKDRRVAILAQSGMLGETPDFQRMLADLHSLVSETNVSDSTRDGGDDGDDDAVHPIVSD